MLSARSAGAPVARGGGGGRTGGGAVHSPKCLLGASRCQAPPGLGRTRGWMSVHPVRATPVLRAPPPPPQSHQRHHHGPDQDPRGCHSGLLTLLQGQQGPVSSSHGHISRDLLRVGAGRGLTSPVLFHTQLRTWRDAAWRCPRPPPSKSACPPCSSPPARVSAVTGVTACLLHSVLRLPPPLDSWLNLTHLSICSRALHV